MVRQHVTRQARGSAYCLGEQLQRTLRNCPQSQRATSSKADPPLEATMSVTNLEGKKVTSVQLDCLTWTSCLRDTGTKTCVHCSAVQLPLCLTMFLSLPPRCPSQYTNLEPRIHAKTIPWLPGTWSRQGFAKQKGISGRDK